MLIQPRLAAKAISGDHSRAKLLDTEMPCSQARDTMAHTRGGTLPWYPRWGGAGRLGAWARADNFNVGRDGQLRAAVIKGLVEPNVQLHQAIRQAEVQTTDEGV